MLNHKLWICSFCGASLILAHLGRAHPNPLDHRSSATSSRTATPVLIRKSIVTLPTPSSNAEMTRTTATTNVKQTQESSPVASRGGRVRPPPSMRFGLSEMAMAMSWTAEINHRLRLVAAATSNTEPAQPLGEEQRSQIGQQYASWVERGPWIQQPTLLPRTTLATTNSWCTPRSHYLPAPGVRGEQVQLRGGGGTSIVIANAATTTTTSRILMDRESPWHEYDGEELTMFHSNTVCHTPMHRSISNNLSGQMHSDCGNLEVFLRNVATALDIRMDTDVTTATTSPMDTSKVAENKKDGSFILAVAMIYLDRACSVDTSRTMISAPPCPFCTHRTVRRLALSALLLAVQAVRGTSLEEVFSRLEPFLVDISYTDLQCMVDWMLRALGDTGFFVAGHHMREWKEAWQHHNLVDPSMKSTRSIPALAS